MVNAIKLIWDERGDGFEARIMGLSYIITPSKMIDHFRLYLDMDAVEYFPTLESAKEAAQEDFARRVNRVVTYKDKQLLELLRQWIPLRRNIIAGESPEMGVIYRKMLDVLSEE